MPKKTPRLKPDTVLKNYWNNKEQFADLFNAVLFQGRPVILPEELEDADTEESSVLKHNGYVESIQSARDNIKIRKKSLAHKVELAMLGIEGQEHIHYAMPMRVMGYDYGVYKKQYDSNAANYKTPQSMEQEEYLSRMKKDDKLIPVITLVVYYGEKPWDGATSLHGMLDIGEELSAYVNDYRMLFVEARKNDLLLHNLNNIDLFNLLEILLDKTRLPKETRDRAIHYVEEHHVDKSVILTVAGTASCSIDYHALDKEGGAAMFTVFEETRKEGILEGIKEGKIAGIIELGSELGLSRQDILEKLQSKLDISPQDAQEYFDSFQKHSS